MVKSLKLFLAGFFFIGSLSYIQAQCTPGDETTCPDPENNGQICPDTLPQAEINELYSQEFTILAPAEYVLDSASGTVINLHHVQLMNLGNLPPGITYVSNSPDSVFNVGTYYCVLMEGTPTEEGDFPLHITVDVYVPGIFGSPPIYVATLTDSTSLAIQVGDPSSITERSPVDGLTFSPNPFSREIRFQFSHDDPQELIFEVFDLPGNLVHSEKILPQQGLNRFQYDGRTLNPGAYIFRLRDQFGSVSGRIIKSK